MIDDSSFLELTTVKIKLYLTISSSTASLNIVWLFFKNVLFYHGRGFEIHVGEFQV